MKTNHILAALLLATASAIANAEEPQDDKGIIFIDLNRPRISYSFSASSQGWQWANASPVYNGPNSIWYNGMLSHVGTNNPNVFGIWNSPAIEHYISLGSEKDASDNKLINFSSLLYRTRWVVSSDAANEAQTPGFRFRASREDFSETYELGISSTGTPRLAPGGGGLEYVQFMPSWDFNDKFRFAFDVTNFNGADSATARVSLDYMANEDVTDIKLGTAGTATTFNFANSNANGFTFTGVDAPSFSAAFGTSTNTGLRISPNLLLEFKDAGSDAAGTNKGAETTSFGFWSRETNITLVPETLYVISWRMSSTLLEAQKNTVPTFRLRTNETSNEISSSLQVESLDSNTRLPTSTTDITYTTYFYCPLDLEDQKLILSFDLINPPGSGNAPFGGVTLEQITVTPYFDIM